MSTHQVIDYIAKKLPKAFVLENVKRLLTLSGGAVYRKIMAALHKVGKYVVFDSVLDTADSLLPQHRERWYCVGIRMDTYDEEGAPFSFPPKIAQSVAERQDVMEPCTNYK